MNKAQALHKFWSSFGLKAYDENVVLDSKTPFPYIGYQSATDALGSVLNLSASLWYRGDDGSQIEAKTEEIAKVLPAHGYYIMPVDGGYVWIQRGRPFAQRMGDPDDPLIRRMIINIQAEFLTAY